MLIYAKMAKNDTFLAKKWSIFFFKKRRTTFVKVPTQFWKCVFLKYRIFDKCDFIYAKMAKMTHFCPKNGQKNFSEKTPHNMRHFSILVSIFWYFGKKWSVFGQYFGKKWSV